MQVEREREIKAGGEGRGWENGNDGWSFILFLNGFAMIFQANRDNNS